MNHPALIVIVIVIGLALSLIAAFVARTIDGANTGHARHLVGRTSEGHPNRAVHVEVVTRRRPPTRARAPQYLDTEYWLAVGGDPLAIDVLAYAKPASQRGMGS